MIEGDYYSETPRTHEEAREYLIREIRKYEDFVFASVIEDYGQSVPDFYSVAVLIDVPRALRLQRVREHSFLKFGKRVLPGGDLYENEEYFFHKVSLRPENYVTR